MPRYNCVKLADAQAAHAALLRGEDASLTSGTGKTIEFTWHRWTAESGRKVEYISYSYENCSGNAWEWGTVGEVLKDAAGWNTSKIEFIHDGKTMRVPAWQCRIPNMPGRRYYGQLIYVPKDATSEDDIIIIDNGTGDLLPGARVWR